MKNVTLFMNFLFIILVIWNWIYAFDSNSPDNAEAFFPFLLIIPIFISIISIFSKKIYWASLFMNYIFLILFLIFMWAALLNQIEPLRMEDTWNIIFILTYILSIILNIVYLHKSKKNCLEKVK